MCGILKRNNLEYHDIGFAFLPEYYGKGYAFETTGATLMYAKDKLRIPVIAAIVQPDNSRSIGLLEKLGMHFVKAFRFPDSEEGLLLYSNQENKRQLANKPNLGNESLL